MDGKSLPWSAWAGDTWTLPCHVCWGNETIAGLGGEGQFMLPTYLVGNGKQSAAELLGGRREPYRDLRYRQRPAGLLERAPVPRRRWESLRSEPARHPHEGAQGSPRGSPGQQPQSHVVSRHAVGVLADDHVSHAGR